MKLLAKTDQQAVHSALFLIPDENRTPDLNNISEQIQAEIANRLGQTLEWVDGLDEEPNYKLGQIVPSRIIERDPPGFVGTSYWDLYRISEEMHARDPRMIYDSLRIIADEIWNFVDGNRTVNDIAWEIGAEFDFDLEPKHVLELIKGLEGQGFVRLS